MDHHVSSRRSQSLSTVRGAGPELTRHFSVAHRCSMGFRSGRCAGQASVATWFFLSHAHVVRLVCLGSLCYKRIQHTFARKKLRCRRKQMPFEDLNILRRVIVDITRHAFPTPWADMHPHISMLRPPNFLVGLNTLPPKERQSPAPRATA